MNGTRAICDGGKYSYHTTGTIYYVYIEYMLLLIEVHVIYGCSMHGYPSHRRQELEGCDSI